MAVKKNATEAAEGKENTKAKHKKPLTGRRRSHRRQMKRQQGRRKTQTR